ncbi:plekhh1 [Anopheles darlingi]|uniref:Plekhh1 n=1 Tax=Anopheles darlingi TaxID=43151 RepID=W5JHQ5_ANODA|nr:plekhh1 [Anopheles darlingi]
MSRAEEYLIIRHAPPPPSSPWRPTSAATSSRKQQQQHFRPGLTDQGTRSELNQHQQQQPIVMVLSQRSVQVSPHADGVADKKIQKCYTSQDDEPSEASQRPRPEPIPCSTAFNNGDIVFLPGTPGTPGLHVRAMEQRLCDWPKSQNLTGSSPSPNSNPAALQQSSAASAAGGVVAGSLGTEGKGTDPVKISQLESAIEEQKQLRLQDARQVGAKAAKIKEWVTNKLRELEEQNQLLREQNIKCNQQLELLRNHIATTQSSRHSSAAQPVRTSLSLDVQDVKRRSSRRRSESLDPPEHRSLHSSSSASGSHHHPHHHHHHHHHHRRNLSMEPQELARDLAAAVDGLHLIPLNQHSAGHPQAAQSQSTGPQTAGPQSSHQHHHHAPSAHHQHPAPPPPGVGVSPGSDVDAVHDYAEIYTPSREKAPVWLKGLPSGGSSTTTSDSVADLGTPRPPTPPLHRFPSWEAKIYQVANDGLAGAGGGSNGAGDGENESQDQESGSGMTSSLGGVNSRSQTVSGGYCDISVPVYATVKGRASQIRSMPFTGDSSDDSSDGEEGHGAVLTCATSTHNSHNSTSTDNTETSTSGSASSPSKSLKTSSSLSPAKRSGSESPKNKGRGLSDDYAIPPDAVSTIDTTCMDASMPSLLMRTSYADSPNKKMETLEKVGHLAKLGGKLKTWRKRWFVLKNGSLTYWKSQHDVNRKPQGQIALDEACRINRADGASTFEIDTGKKVYYLTADSNATMDDWIRVLQNVQRRNATKLLLSRDDQKPTIQGWVTKVKNGHAKKCWCVLLGKMFLYFKAPGETNPLGQINMRDARVEEVEHVSDSDSEEREDPAQSQARLTVAIYPQHQGVVRPLLQSHLDLSRHDVAYNGSICNSFQGPTYLILPGKQERDNWLYHLTVVSGGGPNAGTQYEQLIQKLMETDGDPSIDYHVVLAQNALQQCLDMPELQSELICALIKQTSRHTGQKLGVGVQVNKKLAKPARQLLLCATQSLFTCDTQQGSVAQANGSSPTSIQLHLSRNADSKTECGKYAAYCERALERTMQNGGRETKPSRMEVLSILLKNPYHHSLPHAIPVHMMNTTYQVVSFDGSTTIEEFHCTLAQEIGCRDSANGFTLFSDDPIEKDLEHYLDPQAKLCDVISKWETALREKGSGKFENSRVIQLTYKNRLYWKHAAKLETEKERLLLCYQINLQVVQGRFPLSRDLALELSSLMAQIDMGDFSADKAKTSSLQALDKFYPYRYRDALNQDGLKELQELLSVKWTLLRGRSVLDCVRIYLTCARKWPFFGAALFQAKPRHSDQAMAWLAVSEDALSVLELSSMATIARYPYSSVMTFGGCQDDFMLVVSAEDTLQSVSNEQKLLFAMSKPKILEITLLIADYMNALGHTLPGTPQMNTLTRNGSHRSIRSRALPGSLTGTPAHNTLNSHATHANNTLTSHSHTLNSHVSHTLSSHGQPDILKSTPDHQRLKKGTYRE